MPKIESDKEINYKFQKATALHKNGNFEEAKNLYKNILIKAPEHFDSLQLLGLIELELENFDNSILYLKKAIEVQDDQAHVHNNLGNVYLKLNQFDEAIDSFSRAISLGGDFKYKYLYNRANCFQINEKFEEAIIDYDRSLVLKVDFSEAYFGKGETLSKLNKYLEAIKYLINSIELNSDSPKAYYLLGNCLHQVENFDAAIESFDKAINLDPQYIEAYYLKAKSLSDVSRLEESLEALKLACELDQGDLNTSMTYASGLLMTKEYETALNIYTNIITKSSSLGLAYCNRGYTFTLLKRYDEALIDLNKAIEIDPKISESYTNKALLLYQLKKYDEALEISNIAIGLDDKKAANFVTRANTCVNLEKFQDAMEDFNRALVIDHKNLQAFLGKGSLLMKLKNHADALVTYLQGLNFHPKSPELCHNCGTIYHELGMVVKALDFYDKAIEYNPNMFQSIFNKSLALLLDLQLEEGWKLYEFRWQDENFNSIPFPTLRPKWQKPIAVNDRVLVWAEQGVGDEIMFASMYAPFLKLAPGALFQISPKLQSLFKRSFPDVCLISKNEVLNDHAFDYQLPLGDLPKFLLNRVDSFGELSKNYLIPNSSQIEKVKNILGTASGKLVGISWKSANPSKGFDRSIQLAELIKALHPLGFRFVNLQYGAEEYEFAKIRDAFGVTILQIPDIDSFHDIDGLASIISACDLVVTSDNSVVHLAGAIGKDTRLLLPKSADFRWFLNSKTSHWYPSVKIYRQTDFGQWLTALEPLIQDLSSL